jgi:hypothetical protein
VSLNSVFCLNADADQILPDVRWNDSRREFAQLTVGSPAVPHNGFAVPPLKAFDSFWNLLLARSFRRTYFPVNSSTSSSPSIRVSKLNGGRSSSGIAFLLPPLLAVGLAGIVAAGFECWSGEGEGP